jgi:hypothetical protein
MNLKQALKRIEELERRVKELEARPVQETHQWPTGPAWVITYPTLDTLGSGQEE